MRALFPAMTGHPASPETPAIEPDAFARCLPARTIEFRAGSSRSWCCWPSCSARCPVTWWHEWRRSPGSWGSTRGCSRRRLDSPPEASAWWRRASSATGTRRPGTQRTCSPCTPRSCRRPGRRRPSWPGTTGPPAAGRGPPGRRRRRQVDRGAPGGIGRSVGARWHQPLPTRRRPGAGGTRRAALRLLRGGPGAVNGRDPALGARRGSVGWCR